MLICARRLARARARARDNIYIKIYTCIFIANPDMRHTAGAIVTTGVRATMSQRKERERERHTRRFVNTGVPGVPAPDSVFPFVPPLNAATESTRLE